MSKRSLERRLTKIGTRLKGLRGELAVVEEQLLYLGEDAEDQTIRAMVAETGSSSFDARSAQGNFENMSKHRSRMIVEIAELEQKQDELLDQMLNTK
jgi:phosphatidylserine/phosphatidylglycerophosphate/cardiolipin synthase-like enzyme